MSEEEEKRLTELSVELSDENGIIATAKLPEVQLAVTLTIYARLQGLCMRKLEVLVDVDEDGQPYFTVHRGKE